MRLTNFLFAAAIALLASCEAVSAVTDLTHAKLSTMASPDVVQAVEVTHVSKRLLRTTKTEKYEDEDSDDDLGSEDDDDLDSEDEDEERLIMIPNFNKKGDKDLLEKIRKYPGAEEQIQIWRGAEKSIQQVKKELGTSPQHKLLFNLYVATVMRNNHVQRIWS